MWRAFCKTPIASSVVTADIVKKVYPTPQSRREQAIRFTVSELGNKIEAVKAVYMQSDGMQPPVYLEPLPELIAENSVWHLAFKTRNHDDHAELD